MSDLYDLNEAIAQAIEKLNRTDGEGMTIANFLRRASEQERIVKDCDYCGEMMLAGRRFCDETCKEAHEAPMPSGW
tara:strand:+ start:218 stop:445 length:228 start_codon:yes stop_codon:yes gene_type:complete